MTDFDTETYPYLVLASASPRRAELLRQLKLPFETLSITVDESQRRGEVVADYVERMACEKAQCAWTQKSELGKEGSRPVILSADTCGEIAGELLSKPMDFSDAKRLLSRLSGNAHRIYTAFALYDGDKLHVETVASSVQFDTITPQQIEAYWATGEPCDKAGAYAIQGIGAQFVAHLSGSYSSVMGLPLFELARALPAFNIRTLLS